MLEMVSSVYYVYIYINCDDNILDIINDVYNLCVEFKC